MIGKIRVGAPGVFMDDGVVRRNIVADSALKRKKDFD